MTGKRKYANRVPTTKRVGPKTPVEMLLDRKGQLEAEIKDADRALRLAERHREKFTAQRAGLFAELEALNEGIATLGGPPEK